jgi:hypothetical protein
MSPFERPLHGGGGEVHWYEATGIGKREFKIKRLL